MPSGSRPFTGSSNSSTGGSPSSAPAMPSRCRMPSENPPARRRAASARPDLLEHLVHPPGGQAVVLRHPQQVVAGLPAGMYGARVEQRTDLAQRRTQVSVAAATDQGAAAVRRVQPEDHPHRRRLAGAVRPDEPGHLTRLDRERQTVHRDGRAVPLAQLANLDAVCLHARDATGRPGRASSRSRAVFGVPRVRDAADDRSGDGQCDRESGPGAGRPDAASAARRIAGSRDASVRRRGRPRPARGPGGRRTGATRPAWTSAPRSLLGAALDGAAGLPAGAPGAGGAGRHAGQ